MFKIQEDTQEFRKIQEDTKGARHTPWNTDFVNKIEEKSNTVFSQPQRL